jgi:hypothetical protein
MPLRFAFLVLEEHPYGREMLRILLEWGLAPGLIVEEVSEVAAEARQVPHPHCGPAGPTADR